MAGCYPDPAAAGKPAAPRDPGEICGSVAPTAMEPKRTDPDVVRGSSGAESALQRFDEAHHSLSSVLGDLLATGAVSPGELIDALGIEALERYLPSVLRVRMMRIALQEGRAGRPFDDEALLGAISPALLAAHLPPAVLRGAIARLCPPPEEVTEEHEMLDEGDEVTVAISGQETEALLASMPDLTLTGHRDLDELPRPQRDSANP